MQTKNKKSTVQIIKKMHLSYKGWAPHTQIRAVTHKIGNNFTSRDKSN